MNKIYILWLRQLKRYIRSPSRIIGALAQPMLYLLALGFGFGAVFRQAGQGDYLHFLTPGIIGMSIIFTAIFSGMEVIMDRQFGFLKETLVAPMPRFNIMLGRTMGGATLATIQGALVMLLSLGLGFRPGNSMALLAVIPYMFLVALMFTSLGTAIASALNDMQGFPLIISFLIMPMFFLSGALYPLTGLPKALAIAAQLNPLSYGIDAFREVLIDAGHYSLGTDTIVLLGITLLFLIAGSLFFNRVQV